MLEGLYEVDWKNLTHAYGSASDVPGMILSLASPEEKERAYGFQLLEQNLCHKGALYEASAYIVTFLNQLLEHPLFEEKPRLLELLSVLATGQAPLDVFKDVGLIDLDESDPDLHLRLTLERTWARLANESVREHRQLYFQLLHHIDPDVRIAAAYLLSQMVNAGDGLISELGKRLEDEFDPAVKASLLFAIGCRNGGYETLNIDIAQFKGPGVHPLMQVAVLMSLTRSQRRGAPEWVMTGLIDLLSTLDPSLPLAYAALPWAEGHMFADIAICLCHFGSEASDAIVPDLIRVLDRVDPVSSVSIAYAMLSLGMDPGLPRKLLSDLQFAQLSAIAGSSVLWEKSAVVSRLLALFDLPDKQHSLSDFLQ